MIIRLLRKSTFLFLLLVAYSGVSQDKAVKEKIAELDQLIAQELYTQANTILEKQIEALVSSDEADYIAEYAYYIGKITLEDKNMPRAIAAINQFLEKIEKLQLSQRARYRAYINIVNFYDEIGDSKRSLAISLKALALVRKMEDATGEEIGKMYYNLGVEYFSLGEIEKAGLYFTRARLQYESFPNTAKENISDMYNGLGAIMWMSSKLDSAAICYNKAVSTALQREGNAMENLFQATSIRANISLVLRAQGKLTEALEIHEKVINDYQTVIKNVSDTETREKAKQHRLLSIYNMAAIYTDIGKVSKARDFIAYSYKIAQGLLSPSDPELPRYQIALGETELSLKNYDAAIALLNKGVKGLKDLQIDDPFWEGKARFALAKGYWRKEDTQKADELFDAAELLFSRALGNAYDETFFSFLRDKAIFLASIGKDAKAIETAKKGYTYLTDIKEEDNLFIYRAIGNICEVYYLLEDYPNTLKWATKGIDLLNQKSDTRKLSNIQVNFNKPNLLALQVASTYHLTPKKTPSFLEEQLQVLQEATAILERRKVVVFSAVDINILNADYKIINDLAKKINLELYEKTKDASYLNKTISLHESGVYTRIRTKLNMVNNLGFTDVPDVVTKREETLKNKLSNTLTNGNEIKEYFKYNEGFTVFLDSLKQRFPKYYKMRYATIEESLLKLREKIPLNTTLLRYFFVEDALYAYIATRTEEHLIPLSFTKDTKEINLLSDFSNDITTISKASNILYNELWGPLADKIRTEKVIIFPDRELFNLSFEVLTPNVITSYQDFSTESLLSTYSISYNYSLFLLNDDRKPIAYKNDFVAFAPEFNDTMKSDYEVAITDSIHLDKTYLTLLPQPFSLTLAQKYSKRFQGTSFVNEKALKQLFTNTVREHKIIHIATHATSDNVNPELSRLVFAKNTSDSTRINDNYLYNYEIYNQNLSANLAVLTACETGKPAYQAGEGMISLAHAFNYAGSESMLTSLWRIDEKTSTEIIAYFYTYLEKGYAKDKALRNAKLDYIKNSKGDIIAPQYWAGLILMGDTTPILISEDRTMFFFWLIILILGLLFVLMIYRRRYH